MSKKKLLFPRSGELRTSCAKLRGLTYLIEGCGDRPTMPLDEDTCFYGVSLIMSDIHDEIYRFALAAEEWEIGNAKS